MRDHIRKIYGHKYKAILQFVGATKVAYPMILVEFMPISLHDKIYKKTCLTKSQVLPISRDIASALNYIHLWRPQPILHRDVSSHNVFLTPMNTHLFRGKLSNFGSANYQNEISSKEALCNPAYAAPECHYSDFFQLWMYIVLESCWWEWSPIIILLKPHMRNRIVSRP